MHMGSARGSLAQAPGMQGRSNGVSTHKRPGKHHLSLLARLIQSLKTLTAEALIEPHLGGEREGTPAEACSAAFGLCEVAYDGARCPGCCSSACSRAPAGPVHMPKTARARNVGAAGACGAQ